MNATLTLKGRITAVLVASGFTEKTEAVPNRLPAFIVTEGADASVTLCWIARRDDRVLMIAKYERALRENGLTVDNRGDHLYVHQPEEDVRR